MKGKVARVTGSTSGLVLNGFGDAAAIQERAGPDIAVNNAGIQHVASFHAIKAARPQMKRRGWGRIINIAAAQIRSASLSIDGGWTAQ